MIQPKEITFEEGWSNLQKGVTKLIRILEGEPEPQFTTQQNVDLYTTAFTMCTQKPRKYKEQLYDKYREVIEDYTIQTVLPSLREKHGENMLRELVRRSNNHKLMVKWFIKILFCLDRDIGLKIVPSLRETGLRCFYDLVYCEMQSKAKEAVLALIRKEREGEQIDRTLVKNVIDIYVDNGMGTMDVYEEDFEIYLFQDTAAYYSRKASRWIQEDSCPDYMLKTEECLKKERERVTHYLYPSAEPKLVEKTQKELLVVVAKQLLENEHSGCRALLRDEKMDDISRMYRLYHPIPQGLEHVADLFKQHITEERNDLINQVDDASTSTNQVVNELHDKYMVYVIECFQNHTLFHKALKETFEILRKEGGSEKLE